MASCNICHNCSYFGSRTRGKKATNVKIKKNKIRGINYGRTRSNN